MKLRSELPFRRIAVVLAGGGAYGAYEAGALRALTAAGLEPAIVAGVSVGALNAVAWLSHAGDTAPLERVWLGLRPERLGIRWTMLFLRAFGGFLIAFGALEALLLIAGLPENAVAARFASIRQLGGYLRVSGTIEFASWLLVAALGFGLASWAPQLDDVLSQLAQRAARRRLNDALGMTVIAGAGLYAFALVTEIPWPLRLHLVVWLLALASWVVVHVPPLRSRLARVWLRLMPETGGRGLWRNRSRRRVIHELAASGDASRLVRGPVRLLISACDIASGVITYFSNLPAEGSLGAQIAGHPLEHFEVLSTPTEMIDAAVASSAVPVLYEPFAFRGRRYIDAGVFANHPINTVLAAGADAVVLVLVSPSAGIRPENAETHFGEIAGRLSEITTWRDLQSELRQLPPEFSRDGTPARVCVVEPEVPLEGRMFEFDSARAGRLIEQGAGDAVVALRRAGWLADGSERAEAGPGGSA